MNYGVKEHASTLKSLDSNLRQRVSNFGRAAGPEREELRNPCTGDSYGRMENVSWDVLGACETPAVGSQRVKGWRAAA